MVFVVAGFVNHHSFSPTDYSSTSILLRRPPPAFPHPISITAVTFNVHDMYLVSTYRKERITAIAHILKRLNPDVVGLQESWIKSDRQLLMSILKTSRLQYAVYFPSGLVGSGLFIISAYPIVEYWFHRFSARGKWWKLWHSDYWGGKGCALTRVQLTVDHFVDFFNTHTHASYSDDGEYDLERASNLSEVMQFVKCANIPACPAIVVGDFNCSMQESQWDSLVQGGALQRAMATDSAIDHIMVARNPTYRFETIETHEIAEAVEIQGRLIAVSDHFGYMSKIRIVPTNSPV